MSLQVRRARHRAPGTTVDREGWCISGRVKPEDAWPVKIWVKHLEVARKVQAALRANPDVDLRPFFEEDKDLG